MAMFANHLSMDHARSQLFYRCYSTTSARQLRSRRYHDGHPPLSEADLLYGFDNNRIRESKNPTALVSVTNRLLEAVHRALEKYYYFDEAPGTVWIVIIRVPGGENNDGPHHARELALQWHHENADIFKYECLFEWEIPREYVEDHVSVKTLLKREIGWLLGLQNCAKGFPGFRDVQNMLVDIILESDPYSIGRWLGSLAQAFGARTCTYELAFQILRECLSGGYVDEANQFVRLCGSELCGILEFSDICDIELEIRDQLDFYLGI
jgi:hypothetical protein